MKFSTKQEQYDAIRATFPLSDVKTREQGGQQLSYYSVDTIRERLNAVFEGCYEFRIKQVLTTEKTVDMSGELTLHWVDGTSTVVEEWGSSDILFSLKTGNRVNDPFKGAASDCLKRCLVFLGCARELYNEDYRKTLGAQKEASDKATREKAMFTCQDCSGEILAGKVGGKDLTQQEVAVATRSKFKKRLCIPCASKLAKAGE